MNYLMNPYTGSVDTAENWAAEGYTPENSDLVEVVEVDGEWVEVEKQKTEREAAFRKIWSDTHKDYRGRLPDGTYTVMGWAKYGGGLVSASSISDAELAERLESIKRRTPEIHD